MSTQTSARRRERPIRVASGRFPWLLVVPALLGFAFLLLPFLGLLLRAPWPTLGTRLLMPEVLGALRLSLTTATVATLVSLVLGVPLAWLLARTEFPGRRVVRALVTVPLVIPPIVGGVALLLVLGRNGVLGQYIYAWTGYSLPFTTAAVVVAQVFVAMPFLVISVEGALRGADRRYEDAAATLGASRSTIFRRVTLPMVAPGVLAGAVLCWSRALGEFGATVMFAGNFPGRTQTMPLAVYLAMQQSPDAAIVLSLVLLAVSLVILICLRDRWVSAP
ncbi:ABC transporter permease [Nocardiopsis ansamitocini]|uniref:Molybdenum transport system permease n=1 Tax=Nocardiopsis ansamitocini TaxID=1670832 RepID=A0A9W6P5U3_9ACTN|nr:ABC transporter permease [Nocardiopsis ansamitocini]GLU47543.1 molybdate ABC transporter permease [Nocardiopsis ansamitocini]